MTDDDKKWLKKAANGSGQKIEQSACYLGLFSKNYRRDPLCALQLGIAIMVDKPIAIIALEGEPVPEHLKKIAFSIQHVASPDEVGDATKKILRALDGKDQ